MIKSVEGVKTKLISARTMGFHYCTVAVDGHNIGCALIKDILDSIRYCNTPGGKIRTFIHRGYEYAVAKGIEITILTDEEFLEHYMGLPCNKSLLEKEVEKQKRDALAGMQPNNIRTKTEEQVDNISCISRDNKALRNIIKPETKEDKKSDNKRFGPRAITEGKPQAGILTRIKHWLKGDVAFKK